MEISDIDFSTIKANLKAYLQNQSEFTDHNFEGSAWNVLLDTLAYTTYYNNVHTNFAFSETFLDSADNRSSIISRAKELGYTPYSTQSSIAVITFTFSVTGNPAQYTIPKGTVFNSKTNSTTYKFITTEDILVEKSISNTYTTSLTLHQGFYNTYTYTVNLNDPNQRYIIPSKTCDTRFLTVKVKNTSSDTLWNTYTNVSELSIGDIDSSTNVYFINETFDGYFKVYFGDDVIGKAIQTGNIIQLTYLDTDGKSANGISSFTLGSTLSGVTNSSITVIQKSYGGSDKESEDSIKYLAPFYYQSQNRAVTIDDYKSIVKNQYGYIDDVSIWGGEDNDPPYYGKVFIAAKPVDYTYLSATMKQSIQDNLTKNYNVLSVRPEVVDPDYINVSVSSTIRYNAKTYTDTEASLETLVTNAITDFFDSTVNKFGKNVNFSKLTSAIDNSSSAIINSTNNLRLSKTVEIYSGISSTYTFSFNNTIYPKSVISNLFTIGSYNYRIRDKQNTNDITTGTLSLYRESGELVNDNIGTVDYNSGTISVVNISIDSILNDSIYKLLYMYCSIGPFIDPDNTDVVYADYNVYTNERDQLIRLGDITIILIPDNSL